MNARDLWARSATQRLKRIGFKVKLLDPAQALERKSAGRRQDLELIATGKATPTQVQRKNSFFGGRAKRFRIVDYGGLNEEA